MPTPPSCDDVAEEPDLLGPVSFHPAEVVAGDPTTMQIIVDADVDYLEVELIGSSTGLLAGYGGLAPLSSVALALTLPIGTKHDILTGAYHPKITLCLAGTGNCYGTTGPEGVVVTYHGGIEASDGATYLVRRRSDAGGGPGDLQEGISCIERPLLTIH